MSKNIAVSPFIKALNVGRFLIQVASEEILKGENNNIATATGITIETTIMVVSAFLLGFINYFSILNISNSTPSLSDSFLSNTL